MQCEASDVARWEKCSVDTKAFMFTPRSGLNICETLCGSCHFLARLGFLVLPHPQIRISFPPPASCLPHRVQPYQVPRCIGNSTVMYNICPHRWIRTLSCDTGKTSHDTLDSMHEMHLTCSGRLSFCQTCLLSCTPLRPLSPSCCDTEQKRPIRKHKVD